MNTNQNAHVYKLAFLGISIALNIVLGIITSAIGIPLYLDTLGTVLSAVLYGPVAGIVVGSLSNVISGLIFSPIEIPFFIVNAVVGLITGLIAKKWGWNFIQALVTGIILSIVAPVLGTPIGIWVYGGLSGSWSDVLVTSLVQSGHTIFVASFIRNILSNTVDKIGTSIVAWAILKYAPESALENFAQSSPSIQTKESLS